MICDCTTGLSQLSPFVMELCSKMAPGKPAFNSTSWSAFQQHVSVHVGGEVDCRGCYTAMATLHLLRMDPYNVIEQAGMVDFIKRCQASTKHCPLDVLLEMLGMLLKVLRMWQTIWRSALLLSLQV